MPSSVRDIQILRGNRAGKTALVSSDFRLAAVLVSKEFDLLFFPDRIQRLWRIVTGLIGDFLRHFSLSTEALASFTSRSNSTA